MSLSEIPTDERATSIEMATDHEMRRDALRLYEENIRLRKAIEVIHDITQDTTLNVPCWQHLQNIAATASQTLIANPPANDT